MARYSLVGLSGSLRSSATNTRLLREAARLFGDCDLQIADLNLLLFDADDEKEKGIPAEVQTLSDQIAAADAVLISTPEYNKGPSGVLKNALDWVSRTEGNPWKGKPVAVMSAAAGRAGGERAQMILRSFMVPFRAVVLPGPEVHLANSSNQFDENDRLTSDLYIKTITDLMDALRREIER